MSTQKLTTTLPADTLYVSGTVNGVSTTWTNTAGQTWETVAERSPFQSTLPLRGATAKEST